jgi:hypothetical protein
MDKKLKDRILEILDNTTERYMKFASGNNTLSLIEQAFLDAKWIEPQQPNSLEHGIIGAIKMICQDVAETGECQPHVTFLHSQQPVEGELVPLPFHLHDINIKAGDTLCHICYDMGRAAKAQRVHMIAQGYVKLPSDIDEFGLRLHHIIRRHVSFSEADDEIILDDYAIAQELLRLLGEKP